LTLTNNLDGGTQDVDISFDELSSANVGNDKSISSTVNIGEASGLFGEWSGSLVYSVDVEEYTPFTITSANRTKVGYDANATTFIIPETFVENAVHYKVVGMANDALQNIKSETVVIPKTITNIMPGAFYNMTKLKEFVVADDNPAYVAVDGVLYTKDLTHLVRYPTLKAGEVTIQDGTKYIDYEAFYGCDQITGALVFPDSVVEIADRAFRKATMTSIDLNNVEVIGEGVFYLCNSLAAPIIPESVRSIGEKAFYCMNNDFDRIEIPATVEYLGHMAFSGETYLRTVNVAADNPYYCSVNGVVYNKDKTELVILPFGCNRTVEIYENIQLDKFYASGYGLAGDFSYFNVDENNPYYSDIDGVLFNKDQTKLLNVPKNYIGTVVIPATTEILINNYALKYCNPAAFEVDENNPYYSDIDGVLFNKEQTKLLKYPGRSYRSIYTVPDGVTTIASDAFQLFNINLNTITLADSVTTLENNAINGHLISKLIICAGIETIGSTNFVTSNNLTINYKGSEDQWNSITIAEDTIQNLGASTINYNYIEPATTSLLSLDTNGGTSTMTAYTTTPSMLVYGDVEHGEIVDLSDAVYIFEREGYELIGFSTNPNAIEGGFFFEMPAEDTIVYAIWREIVLEDKCTCGSETEVHSEDCPLYEKNEELGSEEEEILEDEIIEDEPLIENDETVLDDSDKDEIIAPEDSITTPSVYTIKFDANGGLGSMAAQEVDGACELDLNDFTYDGYMFVGWSLSPNGDVIYEDGDLISNLTSDIVLYAVWEVNSKSEKELVEESGEDIEEKEVSEPIEESFEEPIEESEESVVDEPIVEEPIIEEVVEEPIIEEVVEKEEDILEESSELPETE